MTGRISAGILGLGMTVLLSGCDALPASTQTETAFRACEEVIKPKLAAPSTYTRLWADLTARGPITKDEYVLRLERVMDEIKPKADSGDLGTQLALYTIKKQHRCAKTGNGCQEFERAKPVPGEEPVAEAEGESGNQLTYEGSSESKARDTLFVLLEYRANNEFNAPIRAYHFCRMLDASSPYLDGEIPLAEGDAAKKLYKKL
ncbi:MULTISPECIES: hypothetical protein [unclassified Sphingopyxis]|uniref:hypothetical protein n=1 Tax=unclassified Sphingopyxis TaxID=2614943 RepID=UPI00286515B5|nr:MULTISPECIES: hypothetical protein [unclassified Sphingopyxis]MDR6833600.1 hypothetical protein [Sphingopyxis sp. BE122]MDR7225869.1 hypothetical protein [Sphingopyxis sp. BE259]